jgi:hypothetical protein
LKNEEKEKGKSNKVKALISPLLILSPAVGIHSLGYYILAHSRFAPILL